MVFMSRKRIKDLLLRVRVVVRTSKMRKCYVVIYQTTSKNCTGKHAARAARLFFLVHQSYHSFVTSSFLKPPLMYLHSAELNLSGSDKKRKYFPFGMRCTCVSRHSCSLLCLACLRFGSCNVIHLSSGTFNFYLKDSFMFEGPIIL